MEFDAKGASFLDWFRSDRLLQPHYTDIEDESHNHFSIEGDAYAGRYFIINKNYGGCKQDAGWVMLVTEGPCDWEKKTLKILYSEDETFVNWHIGKDHSIVVNLAPHLIFRIRRWINCILESSRTFTHSERKIFPKDGKGLDTSHEED